MSQESLFQKSVNEVKELPQKPSQDELLSLYALYKQATEGDASGDRPGLFDVKGRKKFDAWSTKEGLSSEESMKAYIDLVEELKSKYA